VKGGGEDTKRQRTEEEVSVVWPLAEFENRPNPFEHRGDSTSEPRRNAHPWLVRLDAARQGTVESIWHRRSGIG